MTGGKTFISIATMLCFINSLYLVKWGEICFQCETEKVDHQTDKGNGIHRVHVLWGIHLFIQLIKLQLYAQISTGFLTTIPTTNGKLMHQSIPSPPMWGIWQLGSAWGGICQLKSAPVDSVDKKMNLLRSPCGAFAIPWLENVKHPLMPGDSGGGLPIDWRIIFSEW